MCPHSPTPNFHRSQERSCLSLLFDPSCPSSSYNSSWHCGQKRLLSNSTARQGLLRLFCGLYWQSSPMMVAARTQASEQAARRREDGEREERWVRRRQRSWEVRNRLRLMRAQCTSKSSRLYLLYFLNWSRKQAGTSKCSIVIGIKTTVVVAAKVTTAVTLEFERMLLLMRITSANILIDLTERMISKYFMITTQVQFSELAKKKLHSNQRTSNFLACHPSTTIRNKGSTCDHRFRFTNTVSKRIVIPARQMLSSISRIQAAPSVDTSTSHPLNLITALSPKQLMPRAPCHSLPPAEIEMLNLPSTLPKLRGLSLPKSILMSTESPPRTNSYSQAEGWRRTMVKRLLPSKTRADPLLLPKMPLRSSSHRSLSERTFQTL